MTTVSHLRFGKKPIKSTYLVSKASFLACHKFSFIKRPGHAVQADEGAVFLLNSPFPKDKVWGEIPFEVQKQIIDKKVRFYVIDGRRSPTKSACAARINVTMQTAFFLISGRSRGRRRWSSSRPPSRTRTGTRARTSSR